MIVSLIEELSPFLVVGLFQRFILLLILTLENIDFIFTQFTCFLKADYSVSQT